MGIKASQNHEQQQQQRQQKFMKNEKSEKKEIIVNKIVFNLRLNALFPAE